jgi:hypothetical protein
MMGTMGVMRKKSFTLHTSSFAVAESSPESGAASIAVGQPAQACARARMDFVLSARASRDCELISKDGMTVAYT